MFSNLKEKDKKFNPSYSDVPNIRFSLRLTEKLQEELGTYSQKCNMSMNSLILKCIEYALNNKEDL
jgi:predicted HicB family RNase H-like nuclease